MKRIPVLFAVPLLATVAAAQLPEWSAVPAAPSANVRLEQSWCLIEDGHHLKAFSCFSRRWTELRTVNPPSIRVLNDAIVVQDGAVYYGYSPRTGRFAAQLAWSPTATLAPQVTPQTWFTALIDGDDVHVFQAIEGEWTTLRFAGPPAVTMGTFCALIDDGQEVYGVSAFYGTPVRLPGANGRATVDSCHGNAGIATSTGLVHGFSAYRNTWAPLAVGSAPPTVRSGDRQAAFVAIEEPNRVSFFSGHTGAFTSIATVAATPTVDLQRAVAVVDDFPFTHGYSALTGTASQVTLAAQPTILGQQWFALLDDGTGVFAFSATTGTFTPPIPGTLHEITTRAETAVFQPATASVPQLVYSQFRNSWTPTPTLPQGVASVHQTAASVVLVEPNGGLHGMSIRDGHWIHQPTPPIDEVFVGTNRPNLEMTLVARAGLELWAFNARVPGWCHTTTDAPATVFSGNSAALIVSDGTKVYGFSAWNDAWATTVPAGPVVASSTQVQAAYVRDATHVHAYSGIGQTATSHDYPEYWRAATRGARVRIDVAGEAGAMAYLLFGLAATELPVPGIGTLRVDPGASFLLAAASLPSDGLFGISLQIPTEPSLAGVGLHFQSVVIDGPSIYLTNAVDHTIL